MEDDVMCTWRGRDCYKTSKIPYGLFDLHVNMDVSHSETFDSF